VDLKASIISTGRSLIKPIVSSRVILVPEGSNILLKHYVTTDWLCAGSEKGGLYFTLPSSSSASSSVLTSRRLCNPPKQRRGSLFFFNASLAKYGVTVLRLQFASLSQPPDLLIFSFPVPTETSLILREF
jgi:hypothetical protein